MNQLRGSSPDAPGSSADPRHSIPMTIDGTLLGLITILVLIGFPR
jgi:hypothetical protein